MTDPEHEALIEELRKLRRETSSVKIAAWTGVGFLACALVAGMLEFAWFRKDFGSVLLVALCIVLIVAVLLPWLGKWFYRGATEALVQKDNHRLPKTNESAR